MDGKVWVVTGNEDSILTIEQQPLSNFGVLPHFDIWIEDDERLFNFVANENVSQSQALRLFFRMRSSWIADNGSA